MKFTHEQFLEKLLDRNEHYRLGSFEVVGRYKTANLHILLKNKFGYMSCYPGNLFKGNEPTIGAALNKTNYWINQAIESHGGKFDYSKVTYKSCKGKVIIGCQEHGDFKQLPDGHLIYGCDKCARQSGTYTFTSWKNKGLGNPGIFYILRCFNDDEEFYKVGITAQGSINKRYGTPSKMPYNYEVIKEIKSFDRKAIWDMEHKYLRDNKSNRYTPIIDFPGSVLECFTKINNERI